MRSFEDTGKRLIKRLAFAALICAIATSVPAATEKQYITQEPDKATKPEAVAQQSQNCEEIEQLRKNLQQLKADVRQLRKKVTEIEKDRKVNVLRDVLSREELRAETLQARLRETLERQVGLQIRMEQVDQQLRPENIERIFVGVGMVRPEEARETVRRRLSVEKQGIQAQLELLRQERARLQASLASADAAIQRLRFRLSEAARP